MRPDTVGPTSPAAVLFLSAVGIGVGGNVGAASRLDYTVIGDPVNEAAQLTEAAKEVAGRLLASGATIESAGDDAADRRQVAELHLRGRSTPTRAYAPAP